MNSGSIAKKRLYLLWVLILRNVKSLYRGSVLGVIWTLLNPLLTMFVLSVVYSKVFGRDIVDMEYPVYVLSGMIIFNSIFRQGTTSALTSIVDKRALVMQTTVPVTIYPRVQVLTAIVNYTFSYIALLSVMLIYKQPFKITLLLSFVPVIGTALFTMGVAYFVSTLYVYFRDVKNVYNVFVTLLTYLTPIFYTVESLKSERAEKFLVLNPMYYYVGYFREIIIGNVPSLNYHLLIFGMGVAVYFLGYAFISVNKKKFVFYL